MSTLVSKRAQCARSLQMQDRAARMIPGQTQLLSKRPDQFAPGAWPGYFQKAHGAEVWDLDGNRYLDMSLGGIGANVLGYADPDVDNAVREAIANGVSSSLCCPEEVELAELLCQLHRWATKARFARTGGEAMAMAVRISRAFTGSDTLAFCGYHGWHDWYLAANLQGGDVLSEHLLAGLDCRGVPRGLAGTARPFHYNHPEELELIIDQCRGQLAAVIMEPIRSQWPSPGFLERVRELSRNCGAVLVFDEISSGFRLTSGGAHLVLNVDPDMAVFSKAIANGYAMAAVIGREEIMNAAETTFISSTNWTERIGPSAALATIRKHADCHVADHLQKIGARVQDGWSTIAHKWDLPVTVSGIAPLSHFQFDHDEGLAMKAFMVKAMLERGILASNLFYAMWSHTEEHVERYLQALDDVFAGLVRALATEMIRDRNRVRPAAAGFKRLV